MTRTLRLFSVLAVGLLLSACATSVPIDQPPLAAADDARYQVTLGTQDINYSGLAGVRPYTVRVIPQFYDDCVDVAVSSGARSALRPFRLDPATFPANLQGVFCHNPGADAYVYNVSAELSRLAQFGNRGRITEFRNPQPGNNTWDVRFNALPLMPEALMVAGELNWNLQVTAYLAFDGQYQDSPFRQGYTLEHRNLPGFGIVSVATGRNSFGFPIALAMLRPPGGQYVLGVLMGGFHPNTLRATNASATDYVLQLLLLAR